MKEISNLVKCSFSVNGNNGAPVEEKTLTLNFGKSKSKPTTIKQLKDAIIN